MGGSGIGYRSPSADGSGRNDIELGPIDPTITVWGINRGRLDVRGAIIKHHKAWWRHGFDGRERICAPIR